LEKGAMARQSIVTVPKPKSPILANSCTILEYAIESVESLLEIYKIFTKGRGRGAPSTEEQDQLRAMIVFAGAGLDAALKQIVHDALLAVVGKSPGAHEELVKFVERRLVRGGSEGGIGLNAKEMAALLLAPSPRGAAIDMLARELTSRSLQSYEELERLLRFLGIADLTLDKASLKAAFDARNRIVHEMDMDLDNPTRKRKSWKRDEMVAQARVLLETAGNIVAKIDAILS
jgi:hypothetical protein